MRRIKFSFLCALCLFFSSCIHKEVQDNDDCITIEVKGFVGKELKLSEMVSSVRVLPILTPQDDPVGEVKDICIVDSTVYIWDPLSAAVYAIDRFSGVLRKKLSNRGNGPGEYVQPVGIAADQDGVYVLDPPAQQILCFDKALNLLKTVRLDFSASEFLPLENGFLLYNVETVPFRFTCVDKEGKVKARYISNKEHVESRFGIEGNLFSKCGEEAFFTVPFGETIYQLNDGQIEKRVYIDFASLKIPEEVNREAVDLFETPYAFLASYFVLSEKQVVFSYFHDQKRYYGFWKGDADSFLTGSIDSEKAPFPFFPRWQFENTLVGTCLYGDVKDSPLLLPPVKSSYTIEDETQVLLFFEMNGNK